MSRLLTIFNRVMPCWHRDDSDSDDDNKPITNCDTGQPLTATQRKFLRQLDTKATDKSKDGCSQLAMAISNYCQDRESAKVSHTEHAARHHTGDFWYMVRVKTTTTGAGDKSKKLHYGMYVTYHNGMVTSERHTTTMPENSNDKTTSYDRFDKPEREMFEYKSCFCPPAKSGVEKFSVMYSKGCPK